MVDKSLRLKIHVTGPGETVEIAVEMAAQDALKNLFGTTDTAAPLRFNTQEATTVQSLPLSKWKPSAFSS